MVPGWCQRPSSATASPVGLDEEVIAHREKALAHLAAAPAGVVGERSVAVLRGAPGVDFAHTEGQTPSGELSMCEAFAAARERNAFWAADSTGAG
jgi:hypothetical protein